MNNKKSPGVKAKQEYVSKSFGTVIHIWEPVFRSNYYYVIAPSYAEYCKTVKHHFKIDVSQEKQYEPLGHTTCYKKDEGTLVFIWTRNHTPDVLAHECFHAMFFELNSKGVRLAEDSDEVYAYMIQFLMKNILQHLNQSKRKAK